MQNVLLSLFINGMMAVLLVVTISYCWRLNSRIRVLQDSKSELARIIREFDESTKRATQSISEIHEATSRLSENIQHKIDKANFLADDLQYMIEKGSKLAGKPDAGAPSQRGPLPTRVAAREPLGGAGIAALANKRAGAVEEAEAEQAEPLLKKPTRARSRAEQELRQVLGGKSESDS